MFESYPRCSEDEKAYQCGSRFRCDVLAQPERHGDRENDEVKQHVCRSMAVERGRYAVHGWGTVRISCCLSGTEIPEGPYRYTMDSWVSPARPVKRSRYAIRVVRRTAMIFSSTSHRRLVGRTRAADAHIKSRSPVRLTKEQELGIRILCPTLRPQQGQRR